MSFRFRAGWQIEQVESGGRENNRPTDQLLFRPGYTQRTGRARFFSYSYNTCMYKFCICMFYCYITRFPDGQCREKLRGAKKTRLVWCHIQKKPLGGAAGRDTVSGLEHCGRSTPVRLRGRDRKEGEQRAEGGPAGAACPQSQLFFLPPPLHAVRCFVGFTGVVGWNLLVPPSHPSLPSWSDRSVEVWLAHVAPDRRTDGFILWSRGQIVKN